MMYFGCCGFHRSRVDVCIIAHVFMMFRAFWLGLSFACFAFVLVFMIFFVVLLPSYFWHSAITVVLLIFLVYIFLFSSVFSGVSSLYDNSANMVLPWLPIGGGDIFFE